MKLPDHPTLRIEPHGWLVPVLPGQSLLEAAQVAGIQLPRSCRNGTCRACRCTLQQGEIRYRIDWPGLLAEERAEGWILPCVAEVAAGSASPLVIDAPQATLATSATSAATATSTTSPPRPA